MRGVDAARNAAIAAQVVARHVVDDPVLLTLQVARKAPHGVSQRVARVLTRLPGAGTRALGHQLLGAKEFYAPAGMLLKNTSPTSRNARWSTMQRRVAAEVAIGYGLVDWRDDSLPAVTRARAAWDSGAVSEAIALAEDGEAVSFARRLEGEAQLLRPGFELSLPARNIPNAAPEQAAPVAGEGEPRVLHLLTNSLPGTQSGYTLRTQRLLRALQDAGVSIYAQTRIAYPVMVGQLLAAEQVERQGVTYRRVLPWRLAVTHPERLRQWVGSACALARSNGVDLVHTTTNYPNALVAQAVAKALDVPWVYEARGVMEETWVSHKKSARARDEAESSERFRLIRARETELMLASDHVITLSETMKELFVGRGVPAEKITVVPNAVEDDLFEKTLSPGEARARLATEIPRLAEPLRASGADTVWVGSVSSLVDYEGFDVLLRAVALLRARGLDVRVLLAGDGVARPGLQRLAAELAAFEDQAGNPIGEFAVLAGRLPAELAFVAHQALDIFAVPRTGARVCRSVTPLKPIEAMALGRPVVASDIPPLAELIAGTGRPTGLVCSPESPQALAEAIERLAADEKLRAELAAAGRDFAATRTWSANARAVHALYERLVGRFEGILGEGDKQ
ncbi:glycosyltransferase family 4 protein [Rothia sp. LK2588]|uniref:glycosyltransferase family 4 protein n=1 Tax=Rothia sp. LK2588 TaxID=3114369 RepID=UPI0034CFDC92